jgi:hypothetical protein
MKYRTKQFMAITLMAAMLTLLVSFGVAFAAEELVTGEITQVVQAVDKNGNDYTRLIVTFNRSLQGQDYSVGLPVMAFGALAETAAAKTEGDTLKAICQKRLFNDRESFTIISILE